MSSFLKRSLAILSMLALFGQGCTKGLDTATAKAAQPVTLNIWGVVDDDTAYTDVFNDYRKLYPNVSINYRRLRLEEYETELVNALAEDRGPDIFLIHNDWTDKYLTKLIPMPPVTNVAQHVTTGTIKKETTYVLQAVPSITNKSYKDRFADVVLADTIRNVNVSSDPDKPLFQDRIMGMPIGIDTMALYYNKDLLNAAGIPTPPATWSEFQDDVKKLVKLDRQGNIIQAGAGIGTAYNVERAADLISILMIQNGAEMTTENGDPSFQLMPPNLEGRDVPPGVQALGFYTDFANPNKENYTWNSSQPNSLDAFLQGRSAFFFGYSYHLPQIRVGAPRLNLGISKLPQIEGNPVKNFANYWYFAVSKKTQHADIAWNLLNFLIKPDESKKVLDVVKRPAAQKAQLASQMDDEDVGVFASEVLTATSWYRGNDPQTMENALLSMIESVVAGTSNAQDAARLAADKIGQTIH